MDKSQKYYLKAMDKYNEGYIDAAIELCEKSISLNIKNAAAINLKGLLYYIKGDINEASILWKLNSKANKNQVALKYLQGLEQDEKRMKLYTEGIKLLNSLEIKEALNKFDLCSESDFNSINVNNYIALCKIKQGNYVSAIEHINLVLKVDKKNKMAAESLKLIESYGEVKQKSIKSPILIFVLIFMLALAGYGGLKIINNKKASLSYKKPTTKYVTKKNNIEISKIDNKKEIINKEKVQFPAEDIKDSINKKDFLKLNAFLLQWSKKAESINDKALIAKGKELMEQEGISYFYSQGINLMKNKNFKSAKDLFLNAYRYSSQNYLQSHIIYMLGVCYENIFDIEKAIKYYDTYLQRFSHGDYVDVVLYKLALLNKDIDINKAKRYANILNQKYNSSQYNNSIIKEILSK